MPLPSRTAVSRTFTMCPPTYFAVTYAINAWMDPAVAVDTGLAQDQWQSVRDAYLAAGHRVHLLEAHPVASDMVFAANGAVTVGGRSLLSRMRHRQRMMEPAGHRALLERLGVSVTVAEHTAEGEGDFIVGTREIFAGWGFRTELGAHTQAEQVLGVPVVSLRLVDPRFYHLDVALVVLDDTTAACFPGAFDRAGLRVLRHRFPDLIEVAEADAEAFALNAVSDGQNVFVDASADGFTAQLADRGFTPVPLAMSEFRKSGGSVKCVTGELWSPRPTILAAAA
jgi:N-dimethylarginine dimethylaminohydrolase